MWVLAQDKDNPDLNLNSNPQDADWISLSSAAPKTARTSVKLRRKASDTAIPEHQSRSIKKPVLSSEIGSAEWLALHTAPTPAEWMALSPAERDGEKRPTVRPRWAEPVVPELCGRDACGPVLQANPPPCRPRSSAEPTRDSSSLWRRAKKAAFALVTLAGLCAGVIHTPTPAAAQDAATTAAPFLKIGFGARAEAVGNAASALAADASAVYFNPAGLARMEATPKGLRRDVQIAHTLWFQDIGLTQMAYAQPFANRPGTWGVALTRLGVSGLERRSGETLKAEGEFGAEDLALAFAYGRKLEGDLPLAVGASVKYIRQSIDVYSGTALALDAGLSWNQPGSKWTFAAGARNLGSGLAVGQESYPLPTSLHLGFAYTAPATFVGEVSFDREGRAQLSFGTEYHFTETFAFRGGYLHKGESAGNAVFDGKGGGFLPGVSAGFGVRFLDRIGLNYAFVPFRDLGNAHRFTLEMRF